MAVEIVANDHHAVFVCNTAGEAFGPAIRVARHGEHANHRVAEEVLDRADRDIRKVWDDDPDQLRELITDTKRDLYPEVAPV